MYQIFISYRRDGGEFLGKMLHERLTAMGYSVFYDVEGLNPGHFNTQLLDVIVSCTDFLLILSPGALDRCDNPGDWVYQEIACALQNEKNLIPVMMRNFQWPENLPAALQELPVYEAVTANNEYFDALLERLAKKFLKSKPVSAPGDSRVLVPIYDVTAVNRMTEAVQIMVSYLAQEKIDNTILREYGRLVEKYAQDTPVTDLSCWQRAMDSLQNPWQNLAPQALVVLQNLHHWILQQGGEQLAQLRSFFHAYNALWSAYDETNGEMRDYVLRDTLSCDGKTYEIRDVLPSQQLNERFLYCTRQGATLLPEVSWFAVEDGSLRPLSLQEDGPLITGLTLNYITACRLFDPFPLWVASRKGEQILQFFPKDSGLQEQLQIQKLFRPEIRGHFGLQRLLSRTEVQLTLGLDSVREVRSGGKDSAYTPFHENVPLDIVDATPYITAPEWIYYVLTCPKGSKNEKCYFHNKPKVYRITVSTDDHFLTYEEIRKPQQLAPGLGERFATRLAAYCLMGVID